MLKPPRRFTASDSPWAALVSHLREWHATHADAPVPRRHVCEDGYRLGEALATVVQHRQNGSLPPAALIVLQPFQIPWKESPRLQRADIDLAAALRARDPSFKPQPGWRTPDGYPLGNRIGYLLHEHERGALDSSLSDALRAADLLAQPREASLAHVLPSPSMWLPAGLRTAIEAYRREHGHLDVPAAYVGHDRYPLGRALHRLRRAYAQGWLTSEAYAWLLESDVPLLSRWPIDQLCDALSRCRDLAALRGADGRPIVGREHRDDTGFPIGEVLWEANRRARRGRLPARDVRRLASYGFAFTAARAIEASDAWLDELAQHLEAFRQARGHVDVPRGYMTLSGYKLRTKLDRARRLHRDKGLPAPILRRLEKLGLAL